MKTRIITSAIIKDGDRYLLAKRANSKKYAPGKWEFISGFIDNNKSAEEIILNELREEINAKGKIVKICLPYVMIDKEARWIILPFIVKLINNKFKINKKEHSEIKWVSTSEIAQFKELKEDFNKLRLMRVI